MTFQTQLDALLYLSTVIFSAWMMGWRMERRGHFVARCIALLAMAIWGFFVIQKYTGSKKQSGDHSGDQILPVEIATDRNRFWGGCLRR